MKIFRFFGMALVAICMFVNFTACSQDDSSDGAGGTSGGDYTSEKKLTKIVSEKFTETFSYDDQGRLIEVVCIQELSEYTYTEVYQHIWGDDAVVVNKQTEVVLPDGYTDDRSSSSYEYCLENGLVQSNDRDEDIETFHYNSSNRLSQIKSRWYTEDYLWDGDKLVTIDEGVIKITYEESCKKGYSPLFVDWLSSDPLFMAHPEIIGARTKQLPATVTQTWNDGPGYGEQTDVISYSYKFDNEGYISQIDIDKNGEKILTLTLTWE